MKGREKAEKRVLGFFKSCDPSGENVRLYKDKFSNMTDREFKKFIESGIIKYYTKPFDIEPSLKEAKKALEFVGVPDKEKITLPFMYKDEDVGDVVTDKKVSVIHIHMKRLQQLIHKENSSSSDMTKRDKTNQAMGDSKSAQLSGTEVAALVAKGYDASLKELLSFRADHPISKQESYDNISTKDTTNIPDTINDPDDKLALNYLNVLLLGMGIDSNLLE